MPGPCHIRTVGHILPLSSQSRVTCVPDTGGMCHQALPSAILSGDALFLAELTVAGTQAAARPVSGPAEPLTPSRLRLRCHLLGSVAPCSAGLFPTVPLRSPPCRVCAGGLLSQRLGAVRPGRVSRCGARAPAAQRSTIQGRACPKLWRVLGRTWFSDEEQGPQSGTTQGPLTGVGEATGIPCLRVPKVTAVSHGIYTSVCARSAHGSCRACVRPKLLDLLMLVSQGGGCDVGLCLLLMEKLRGHFCDTCRHRQRQQPEQQPDRGQGPWGVSLSC